MARPSDWKDEFIPELINMMDKGMFDCDICKKFDISADTFYRWLREKPEFKEAYDKGMECCEAWWLAEMRRRFLQKDDGGFKYCISIMNNKFHKKGWGIREATRAIGQQVNIGKIVVNNMEEYQQLVEEVRQNAKQLNVIDILPEDIQETKQTEVTSGLEHREGEDSQGH